MENADLIRNRIAVLEKALFVLQLDDTTSRVTGFGAPSRNQVEHLRRLDDPDDYTEDNLDWLDAGTSMTAEMMMIVKRNLP